MVKNEHFLKIKVNRDEIYKKMRNFERLEGEVGSLKVWVSKWVQCERKNLRKKKLEEDLG